MEAKEKEDAARKKALELLEKKKEKRENEMKKLDSDIEKCKLEQMRLTSMLSGNSVSKSSRSKNVWDEKKKEGKEWKVVGEKSEDEIVINYHTRTLCVYDGKCTRAVCNFFHEKQTSQNQTVKECMHGEICHAFTCPFHHEERVKSLCVRCLKGKVCDLAPTRLHRLK